MFVEDSLPILVGVSRWADVEGGDWRRHDGLLMSQRDSGYERKERDGYETPAWVTVVRSALDAAAFAFRLTKHF